MSSKDIDTYKELMVEHAKANMLAYGNAQAQRWFTGIAAETLKVKSMTDLDTALDATAVNDEYVAYMQQSADKRVESKAVGLTTLIDLYYSTRRAFRYWYLSGADSHNRDKRDHERYAAFAHANAGGCVKKLCRWLAGMVGNK